MCMSSELGFVNAEEEVTMFTLVALNCFATTASTP
jgi:hypothetical protein